MKHSIHIKTRFGQQFHISNGLFLLDSYQVNNALHRQMTLNYPSVYVSMAVDSLPFRGNMQVKPTFIKKKPFEKKPKYFTRSRCTYRTCCQATKMIKIYSNCQGYTQSRGKKLWIQTLQWRHNGHDGVWNHQRHDCSLDRLYRRRSNKRIKAPH